MRLHKTGAGRVARAWWALALTLALVLASALGAGPAQAQSKPMPDLSGSVDICTQRYKNLTDQNGNPLPACGVVGPVYLDKSPSNINCPAGYCDPGPGRYIQVSAGSALGRYVYTWAFVQDDVRIEADGPTKTHALPAGPAIALKVTAWMGRWPLPRAQIYIDTKGGGRSDAVTDANGEATWNFVPPTRRTMTAELDIWCPGCVNNIQRQIEVLPCDLCGNDRGNPINVASGQKIQTEPQWRDAGAQPLDVTLHYRSAGNVAAGLGEGWSHPYAGALQQDQPPGGGEGQQTARVHLGDGTQAIFTRNKAEEPWKSSNGDLLQSTAEGEQYTRASDDSRWLFAASTDGQQRLVRIDKRGGAVTRIAYSGPNIASVTNGYGRSLRYAYVSTAAGDRLASVTLPHGVQLAYGYDSAGRLIQAGQADGTSRAYLYENAGYPNALTGIVDEAGVRYATFDYDAQGRAVSTEHAGQTDRYALQMRYDGPSAGASLVNTGYLTQSTVSPALYKLGVQVSGPDGRIERYDYQGGDGTLRITGGTNWLTGNVAASETGAANLPARETDHEGNVTTYEWDTGRRLPLARTEATGKPEARTTRTQWHPTYRLPVRVEEAGKVTESTYDEAGNKTAETVTDTATGQARTRGWTYDAQGALTAMTDERGGVWHYSYDAQGNRTQASNPLGQATNYQYDEAARLVREAAPDGTVTSYAYDARGRLASQSVTDGATTQTTRYGYTPQGQLASVVQASGYAVSYAYDAAQRLTGASDNRGNTIAYTLDQAGNRVREEIKDATGQIAQATSRTINELNQVRAVQGAGGATQLQYDANGELIASTDALSNTTRQSLDGLKRTTATTFPDNAAATQQWNALDALTAITDPKGVTTEYETNAFGEVMRETSPDIGEIRYERDAAGDVSKRTDARGIVTTYERDALGRPTRITRLGPNLPMQETRYTWDTRRIGHLARVEDPSGSTEYDYDALGRPTRLAQTQNGDGSTAVTQYAYENGDLKSITYPSGLTAVYERDATGQTIGLSVQAPGGTAKKPKPVEPFIQNLRYTALGQPKAWNWRSGDTASRTFNADGAMTATEFASYALDAAGRITGITQSLWATSTATGTVTSYTTPLAWTATYDGRNRIVSFSRAGASVSYSYDANSNRLTAVNRTTSDIDLDGDFDADDFTLGTAQALTIEGTSNRLLGFTQAVTKVRGTRTVSTTASSVTFSLDAAGNLTSDGLRTFEYGPDNRLSKVRLMSGGEAAIVTYLHNAQGQRVFTSEPQAEQTLPSQDDLSTGFIDWLKKNFRWLFEKAQANATIGTSYVYGAGGAGAIPDWALLGSYDNGSAKGVGRTEYLWLPTSGGMAIPVGMYRGGKLYAIHTDHLGTPRLMTDEQAQPVWQWPYSAFADNKPTGVLKATANAKVAITNSPVLLKATAPAQKLDLGLLGTMRDEASGMADNRTRDLMPQFGRYAQPDTIGMAGGLSRFGHLNQSPLNGVDPDGRFFFVPPMILWGAAAVGAAGWAVWSNTPDGKEALAKAGDKLAEICNPENPEDECDIILDRAQLKSAGIRGKEHEVKAEELGTMKNLSKFDICGCKDGRVVVKFHGCKGPIISVTPYRWK